MGKMYSTKNPNENLNIIIRKENDSFEVGYSFFKKNNGNILSFIEREKHFYKDEYHGVRCTLQRARANISDSNWSTNTDELVEEVLTNYLNDKPFNKFRLK